MNLYSFKLTIPPKEQPLVSKEQQALLNRKKILNLEAAMFKAAEEGQLTPYDFPLKHTFTEGVYARTMTIPKDSVVVGKIHKHAHLNFVSQGLVSVMTEEGVKEIKAPSIFVSAPGTKRVVYAHEDTEWTTVHVTNETDLEKIEDQIIAKSYEELAKLSGASQETLKIKEK